MLSTRPQPQFRLSRYADLSGSTAKLRRLHTAGTLIRLCPGVYLSTSEWNALRFDEPYRYRVMAAAQKMPRSTQFSHDSAAVMWGLPSLGSWSGDVHVLAPRASRGRSMVNVKRHCVGEEDGAPEIDDLTVTSLARTLVDTACTSSFLRAIGMIDAGLRTPEKGELRHHLGATAPARKELLDLLLLLLPRGGSVKARHAIEFGDGRSGSLLESLSRGQFFLMGGGSGENGEEPGRPATTGSERVRSMGLGHSSESSAACGARAPVRAHRTTRIARTTAPAGRSHRRAGFSVERGDGCGREPRKTPRGTGEAAAPFDELRERMEGRG